MKAVIFVLAISLACIASYRLGKPEDILNNISEDDIKEILQNFETREENEDVGLRVPQLVAKYGYPIENHTMVTEDGYILTMHRIPHGKNSTSRSTKVIYLQHGLLCSSGDWVLMGPEKGLAYLLADRGYDVWLGNARGNTYSRNHTKWNPDVDKKEFWDFSWHEIGTIDLPTMIDYILDKTGVEKILYLGHSQGTTAFFVMGSEKPEYMEKIKMMTALAPVAYMKHFPNKIFQLIAKFSGVVSWIMDNLGQFEFLPSDKFIQLLDKWLCESESSIKEICSNILFLVAGYDSDQLNRTMVPVILSNTPAGSSTKQFLHYAQLVDSGKFQKYDYGNDNKQIYGPEYTDHPPEYDLKKVTAPVFLFYGNADALASVQDVEDLGEDLPHVVKTFLNKYKNFTHLDFLWANDVVKLLYNDVFDVLSRY